ncbi:MAG: hypothetical protein QG612_898 [Pseudomonadota bacterium]|nr:hypothetical protein [Pseudomonadota bacterium]
MVAEVVPVWKRHVDASRVAVEDGVGRLLETFSHLCQGVTEASRQADEHIDPAMAASGWPQRRDEILGELISRVAPTRQTRSQLLAQLADGLMQIEDAEHALRAARGMSGAALPACTELRRLDALRQTLAGLTRQVAADLQEDVQHQDRAREWAAQALDRVLVDRPGGREAAMADTIRGLSTRIEQDLEQVLVGLQFQDRMSQMLHGVAADMQRFIEWMAHNEHATHADAMRWLAQLEHSYTMREQQLLHDGRDDGSPPAPSGIEFF